MTELAGQPQGIPTGGQFAPSTHSEPNVTLAVPPVSRPAETLRAIRGHDFYPLADEIAPGRSYTRLTTTGHSARRSSLRTTSKAPCIVF